MSRYLSDTRNGILTKATGYTMGNKAATAFDGRTAPRRSARKTAGSGRKGE